MPFKLPSSHELLAVVPYLLGFNPANSIMVLCLSDNRLGLAQRLDLPRPENSHDVASALLPSLMTENPDAVIIIGFEDNEGQSLPALEALTTALHSHSMPIHDRIVVRDGRWRSLDCHNPSCCPRKEAQYRNRLTCPVSSVSSWAGESPRIVTGSPLPDRSKQDPWLQPSTP